MLYEEGIRNVDEIDPGVSSGALCQMGRGNGDESGHLGFSVDDFGVDSTLGCGVWGPVFRLVQFSSTQDSVLSIIPLVDL